MFSCWIIHWKKNVSLPVGIRRKVFRPCIISTVSRNLTLLTYVETIQTAEKQNIVIQHLNFSTVNIRHFFKSFSRDFPNQNFKNPTVEKSHFKIKPRKKFLLFLSFFNILELTNSSFLGHVELRNTRNDSFTGGGDDSLYSKKLLKTGEIFRLVKTIIFLGMFLGIKMEVWIGQWKSRK